MSSPARSAIASSLASLVPGFLKRKRCAADEEQRKLRAALSAVDRTTLVDACIKLNEANEAHKQRLGELEQAVATLSGVVDSDIRTWSRDDLATYAPMQPAVVATAADAPAQPTGDMAAAGASIEVQTERDRLLSLQPVQAHREASFVFAVSSHEPEAAEWRKGDASYTSPGVGDPTLPADVFESLAFLNLRAMPIDVLWINFDGDDTRYRSSTVEPGRLSVFATQPRHAWRIYDVASGDFLGAALVRAVWGDVPSTYDDGCPGRQSLRALFGFDGFVGPSLRDALAAFEAAPVQTVEAAQGIIEDTFLVVVA